MPVSETTRIAYENYLSAMKADAVKEKENQARGLLRIAGKQEPTAKPEFVYGQSIYIVEDLHVSELLVIGYSADRVYAIRLNGVRTSVSKSEVIWVNESAAHEALERKKQQTIDKNNNTVV